MTNLAIEPARAEDVRSIAELLLRCVPDTVPLSERQILERLSTMHIARDAESGEVVGCINCFETDLGEEIRSVAVAPSHRGQGVGRALVSFMLGSSSGAVACVTRRPEFFQTFGFVLSPEALPKRSAPQAERPRFVMRRVESSSSAHL